MAEILAFENLGGWVTFFYPNLPPNTPPCPHEIIGERIFEIHQKIAEIWKFFENLGGCVTFLTQLTPLPPFNTPRPSKIIGERIFEIH